MYQGMIYKGKPVYYGQTHVRQRYDKCWNVWCVLTYIDTNDATVDDATAAIYFGEPHRNPLQWVNVAVCKNRNLAIEEADRWKESLKNADRPSVVSNLITTSSSISSRTSTVSGSTHVQDGNTVSG